MPSIEKSAGGVLIHNFNGISKALIIRVRKDKFELPKGHIEKGESPEEAAIREMKEETGIVSQLLVDRHLSTISYEFESNGKEICKEVQYFCLSSYGDCVFGEKPKRTREICWVSKEELKAVPMINNELYAIIEQVLL